jgi:bifunctional non-homologous end joining protein LigD
VGLRDDKPAELVEAEHAEPLQQIGKKASGAGGTITSHGVQISSPDRDQYPEAHITKRDLVAYYERVGELMLPHIRNRPLTLIRCPRGQGQRCFVQQHAAASFPEAVKRVAITEASGATEMHVFVEDLAGILACVQMGVLEFHGWASRAAALEAPDRLVFDLDPDPSVSFRSVADAAFLIRDRLQEDGLVSRPMLSGGKGIHVIVPLARTDWPSLSAYAKHFAEALERDAPRQFTSDMAKADRKGRIFVDYLRNERGATAVMPYSTRAKPTASVAAPVAWERLGSITSAQEFTVRRFLDGEAPEPAKWSEQAQHLPQRTPAKSV